MLIPLLKTVCLEMGAGDPVEVAAALDEAALMQRSQVIAVLDQTGVNEDEFFPRLAAASGFPDAGPLPATLEPGVRDALPVRLAVRHCLLPLGLHDDVLDIATSDPWDILARQSLSQTVEHSIRWHLAPRKRIIEALQSIHGVGADTFAQLLEGRTRNVEEDVRQETTILDADDPEASISRFVNQILREALRQRATDIHVEPMEEDLRIRYRVDGVLLEVPVPAQMKILRASLVSRLKIMAHLDIAERRLPQDGRINLQLEGNPIDVRVATIPSVEGESISLRLLKQQRFDFSNLGLDRGVEATIRELIALPNGIILLTGPTGCGKSTSLYTFLSSLNTSERRIVTIEDPVEHKLAGVVQIAVKPEIDLTFANGLRSILRGDPNVIMVGEMRDYETAETAIRAALTGHLVFSTLHTNDAVGGITRLIDLGVEPFLVATSVRAFLAQRLVRVLCPLCRRPHGHSVDYFAQIGFAPPAGATIYEAVGCGQCRGTGYLGRTAVFEICRTTGAMQELITTRQPGSALKEQALRDGLVPLRAAGFHKVCAGVTTVEEVLRVTSIEENRGG